MATFGLKTKNGKANETVAIIADRLRSNNLIKNPFTARTQEIRPGLWVFDIAPVYPNVGALFFLPLLLFLFLPGTLWGVLGLIISGFMLFITAWWSGRFYYLLFYLRTKRGVSYVRKDEIIRRVVFWGKTK